VPPWRDPSPSRPAGPWPPRQLQLQLAVGHRLADPQQQQLDDLLDLVLGQLWNTITSSIRLRNSGRKTFLSSPMIRFFMSSYVIRLIV